jgi:hypothetical protein
MVSDQAEMLIKEYRLGLLQSLFNPSVNAAVILCGMGLAFGFAIVDCFWVAGIVVLLGVCAILPGICAKMGPTALIYNGVEIVARGMKWEHGPSLRCVFLGRGLSVRRGLFGVISLRGDSGHQVLLPESLYLKVNLGVWLQLHCERVEFGPGVARALSES